MSDNLTIPRIIEALVEGGGNKAMAARQLGVERANFKRACRRKGIDVKLMTGVLIVEVRR